MASISAANIISKFLHDATINSDKNDLKVRLWNPNPVTQQYKLDVREAKKFLSALDHYSDKMQGAVLKKLAKLTGDTRTTIAFTENAAKAFNKAAADLGLDLEFTFGQAPMIMRG